MDPSKYVLTLTVGPTSVTTADQVTFTQTTTEVSYSASATSPILQWRFNWDDPSVVETPLAYPDALTAASNFPTTATAVSSAAASTFRYTSTGSKNARLRLYDGANNVIAEKIVVITVGDVRFCISWAVGFTTLALPLQVSNAGYTLALAKTTADPVTTDDTIAFSAGAKHLSSTSQVWWTIDYGAGESSPRTALTMTNVGAAAPNAIASLSNQYTSGGTKLATLRIYDRDGVGANTGLLLASTTVTFTVSGSDHASCWPCLNTRAVYRLLQSYTLWRAPWSRSALSRPWLRSGRLGFSAARQLLRA